RRAVPRQPFSTADVVAGARRTEPVLLFRVAPGEPLQVGGQPRGDRAARSNAARAALARPRARRSRRRCRQPAPGRLDQERDGAAARRAPRCAPGDARRRRYAAQCRGRLLRPFARAVARTLKKRLSRIALLTPLPLPFSLSRPKAEAGSEAE